VNCVYLYPQDDVAYQYRDTPECSFEHDYPLDIGCVYIICVCVPASPTSSEKGTRHEGATTVLAGCVFVCVRVVYVCDVVCVCVVCLFMICTGFADDF
jgi:hypothetical protein